MKNRGVLLKLLLLVAISILAMCLVGILGIQSNRKIYESVDRVRSTADEFQRGVVNISNPLNELRQLSLTMVMAPNRELQMRLNREQQALTKQLNQTFNNWDLPGLSKRERIAFTRLSSDWNDYRQIKDVTVAKVLDGYREEAFINAIQAERDQFEIVNRQIQAWQGAIIEDAADVNRSANTMYHNALFVSTLIIGIATLFLAGFGYITTRKIIKPIEALKNAATKIASHASTATIGEALDERIEVHSEDELGALAHAFNKMVENLRAAMEKLNIEERNLRTAMDKLNVEEQRTQAILNSTADGILTIDANGKIRTLNAAARTLLQYGKSELDGQSITEVVPDFQTDGHDRGSTALLSGESRQLGNEIEAYGLDRQGRKIPIALRVTEMDFSGEKLYIATLQDIAGRKQAAEERARLFEAIRETVQHLSAASAQISATMEQQSSGSEEQASAVTRTVAAVDQAAQSAQESMHLANNVAETSRQADDVGRTGRKALETTRVSMNTVRERVESTAESILLLSQRAKAIGDIITTVNEIADQTNLLALNAAIEASRAGDAGRGFSVVAAEVKSLAQQAQNSTAQIRKILGEIQNATDNAVLATNQGTESVEQASGIVVQAEQTIEDLGKMVSESARAASTIVAASNQQAANMKKITGSMEEIDRTAKQTLAATQQTTLAASDLNTLGNRLGELLAEQRKERKRSD